MDSICSFRHIHSPSLPPASRAEAWRALGGEERARLAGQLGLSRRGGGSPRETRSAAGAAGRRQRAADGARRRSWPQEAPGEKGPGLAIPSLLCDRGQVTALLSCLQVTAEGAATLPASRCRGQGSSLVAPSCLRQAEGGKVAERPGAEGVSGPHRPSLLAQFLVRV